MKASKEAECFGRLDVHYRCLLLERHREVQKHAGRNNTFAVCFSSLQCATLGRTGGRERERPMILFFRFNISWSDLTLGFFSLYIYMFISRFPTFPSIPPFSRGPPLYHLPHLQSIAIYLVLRNRTRKNSYK